MLGRMGEDCWHKRVTAHDGQRRKMTKGRHQQVDGTGWIGNSDPAPGWDFVEGREKLSVKTIVLQPLGANRAKGTGQNN